MIILPPNFLDPMNGFSWALNRGIWILERWFLLLLLLEELDNLQFRCTSICYNLLVSNVFVSICTCSFFPCLLNLKMPDNYVMKFQVVFVIFSCHELYFLPFPVSFMEWKYEALSSSVELVSFPRTTLANREDTTHSN